MPILAMNATRVAGDMSESPSTFEWKYKRLTDIASYWRPVDRIVPPNYMVDELNETDNPCPHPI